MWLGGSQINREPGERDLVAEQGASLLLWAD